MNEKSPVKSYCGGKPNYCTPEETDNVGACVTCGAPKSEWLVDGVNMTPDRVDETAKREHEPLCYLRDDIDRPFGGFEHCGEHDPGAFPVYLAPPKRDSSSWVDCTDEQLMEEVRRRGFVIRDAQVGKKWVGLTDADKQEAFDETQEASGGFWEFADYLETKLKEKNT